MSVAKIWIGTNHMPGTRDFSEALFRRFTVLQFPNRFVDSEAELGPGRMLKDVQLSAKLRAEIPGVLNIMLAALGNAFDRGRLTNPSSSVEAVQNWRRDADQVLSFLEESMVQEPGASIPSAECYGLYREWATEAGILRLVSRKSFTTRIESLGWGEPGKSTGGKRMLFGLRQRLAGDL